MPAIGNGEPNLSFVIRDANENRWSDLLATLVATDPRPLAALLEVKCDSVHREVEVRRVAEPEPVPEPALGTAHELMLEPAPGPRVRTSHRADRLDLLLRHGGHDTAVIEVKLLSDLGPQQLARYRAAFPDADAYRVLHLRNLAVNVHRAEPWTPLTWEDVLDSYSASDNVWAVTTARAWRNQIATLVPTVGPDTVWNDVPDDPAAMELAIRARISWLSTQLDSWCALDHDIEQSSGGGNWAVRIWTRASSPGHVVAAEVQEGMTAYEWRPNPNQPYRNRFRGPVVLVGLRQDNLDTSAGFDWGLLRRAFSAHVVDESGHPRDDRAWQRTSANPRHPLDKANWKATLEAGVPNWVGKGWGMKVARDFGACVFGARYQLAPNSRLAQVDADLQQLQSLLKKMATTAAT